MRIDSKTLFKKIVRMEKYRLNKYGKSMSATSVYNKLVLKTVNCVEVDTGILHIDNNYMRVAKKLFDKLYNKERD